MTRTTLVAKAPVLTCTAPYAAPTPTRRRPQLASFSTDRRSLLIAVGLTAVAILALWHRYASFRSVALDLAVFDQAVWKMAHFQAPEVTTIGWNAFADHLSPVLGLFVPLYWIKATPMWFFLAQGLALGAGFLAVRPLLEAVGLPRRAHWSFQLAYVMSPLLWNGLLFDFHPTTLAIPFLLIGLRAALVNDRRNLVFSAVALFVLRDDLGLAVAMMALCGIRRLCPADRRFRLLLGAGGLAWIAFGGAVATLLGSDRHWDWHYGYIAGTPTEALRHPLHSALAAAEGVWRADNFVLLLAFFSPFILLPLLRPSRCGMLIVCSLPLLMSAAKQFHSPLFHYGVVPFSFLFLGAAEAYHRLPPRWREPHVALAFLTAALCCFYVIGPTVTETLTYQTVDPDDARRALALVHPDDAVAASDHFGARLGQRDNLRVFPYPLADIPPDYPLSEKARDLSAEAAAEIDVIVVWSPWVKEQLKAFDASPRHDDFPFVYRFGDVVVLRRTPA